MTNQCTASGLVHGLTLGGKRVLGSGLSFALLATGLVGVAGTTDHPATQARLAAVTLPASVETPIGSYTNSKVRITVKKSVIGTGADTIVAFIADVTLTDGTSLQSAFANDSFTRGSVETVSSMAKRKKAVLAINGDYSSFRMNGIIISGGTSYLDKGKRPGFAVRKDGTAMVYDETKTNAAKLISENVWMSQSFGPGLVVDGAIQNGIDTYEIDDFGDVNPGDPGSIQGNQPRTGIGFVEKNHFVLIAVDGRGFNNSRGISMIEFAQLFIDNGARLAYNLDGGGSETMYFNGMVINKPSDGKERSTSNMVYIAK